MTNAIAEDDLIGRLAEQQGLSLALTSFSDAVRAAALRALQPSTPLPDGMATVEPAFSFDPSRTAQTA